jgi:NADPH:quinone reductase-like Zn-dependent oxidoreductase
VINSPQKGRQHHTRTMGAVGFRSYGPAEVLEPLKMERPEIGPDTVLVRVAAAGVNPADWLLRSGRLRFVARSRLPFVPGADVAGVVEEVGRAVTRFRPGDAIYAMLPSVAGGGYAEYAAVAEGAVALAPPNLSLAEAAAVPLAALTALQGLRDEATLATGDLVLVNGASGGVGTFAVQIAGALGARVSAATSGRNAELVRGLGAEEVLDYTSEDVTAGEACYDAVFDAVGVYPFRRWKRVLRKGGVAVTVNPVLGNPAARLVARVAGGKRRLGSVFVKPSGPDLETIAGWISSGRVRPVIDETYPLSEAAVAHRYSESKRVRGKLVLIVDERLATASGLS